MIFIGRLRAAWNCSECWRYRRMASVFAVLAALVWMLSPP
jgi:hypothetical protein